jgi:hypothetical protein
MPPFAQHMSLELSPGKVNWENTQQIQPAKKKGSFVKKPIRTSHINLDAYHEPKQAAHKSIDRNKKMTQG